MKTNTGESTSTRAARIDGGDVFWIGRLARACPELLPSPRGRSGRRLQPLAHHDRGRLRIDVEPAPRERAGQCPARRGRGGPPQAERRCRVADLLGRKSPAGRADRVAVGRAGGADPGRPAVPAGIVLRAVTSRGVKWNTIRIGFAEHLLTSP